MRPLDPPIHGNTLEAALSAVAAAEPYTGSADGELRISFTRERDVAEGMMVLLSWGYDYSWNLGSGGGGGTARARVLLRTGTGFDAVAVERLIDG